MLDLSYVLSSQTEERCNPIGSAVDSHTGSDYNMDLIKTWVQKCQEGHYLCNMTNSSQTLPILPTRVIEIETNGQARIMETMGMRAEYLTLSYCWGQGKKLLSTRGSGLYEQFRRKLPVDDTMPKTFRESLQVTTALGYRYLWIDALCIIQDDPEDVGKEMAKMGDIYRQSKLTIFAANGSDTDTGLFCDRDARGSKSCNIQVTLKRDKQCLRKCISIQPFVRYRRSALQTRGWVLQEEVLSGRSLTFNTNAVEWSCVMAFANENHPCMKTLESYDDREEVNENIYSSTNDAMRLTVRHPDIVSKIPPLADSKQRNHFDIWYDMAGNYSQRALSVDSDKLLAIAGLASLMQKNYNLTYVSGLWKEDLQAGLCWWVSSRNDQFRRDGPRSINENFPNYLAPTWSWASAHGMCVKFFRLYLDRLPEEGIQVVDVEVSYLPGSPATFGYIKFAKLSIYTKMRRIFLTPRQTSSKQPTLPVVDEETRPLCVHAFDTPTGLLVGSVSLDSLEVYEDILKRYPAERLHKKIHSAPEGTGGETVRTHQLSSDGYEAWCVPCLVQKDYRGGREMIVLVLTPLNADRREYRRIGMMRTWNEAWSMFMAGKDIHEDREIIHIL